MKRFAPLLVVGTLFFTGCASDDSKVADAPIPEPTAVASAEFNAAVNFAENAVFPDETVKEEVAGSFVQFDMINNFLVTEEPDFLDFFKEEA